MKNDLTQNQIAQYRRDGFLVVEDFLSADELAFWREALTEAVAKRNGNKMPDRKEVYGKGDDADKAYYDNVFDQLINLWQDNEKMRQIMLDERLGKMAAQLADVEFVAQLAHLRVPRIADVRVVRPHDRTASRPAGVEQVLQRLEHVRVAQIPGLGGAVIRRTVVRLRIAHEARVLGGPRCKRSCAAKEPALARNHANASRRQ